MQDKESLIKKVETALTERISPLLADHFGGAVLTEIDDEGVAYIKMTGACGSCPSAEEELTSSFKAILLDACPELTDVRMDKSIDPELLDFAKKLLNKDPR